MDLSKLPKLSETPPPPPEQPESHQYIPPPPPPDISRGSHVAEAWISIAIGAILLVMVPTSLQYASSKVFRTNFAPFPDPTQPYPAKCDFIMFADGTKIYYRDMGQFWSDLAVTGFALVLLFDGLILLFGANRKLVTFAFALTVVATLGNLGYLVMSYSQGLAIMSALAVIFGVYIAIYQWKLLQAVRPIR